MTWITCSFPRSSIFSTQLNSGWGGINYLHRHVTALKKLEATAPTVWDKDKRQAATCQYHPLDGREKPYSTYEWGMYSFSSSCWLAGSWAWPDLLVRVSHLHDTVPSLQVPFPLVRVWGRRGGKEKRDGHPAFLNVGQNKEEPDLAFQHGWHSYLQEKVKSGKKKENHQKRSIVVCTPFFP